MLRSKYTMIRDAPSTNRIYAGFLSLKLSRITVAFNCIIKLLKSDFCSNILADSIMRLLTSSEISTSEGQLFLKTCKLFF